jgi:predicted glycosyltransferase
LTPGGTIWIDFSTAPDPVFFRPLAQRFAARGHPVWATARRYGETAAIAERCGFDAEVVGEHGGRGTMAKAVAIGRRSALLARLARSRRPAVALSFNSYAQAVAARLSGVPFVTVTDYEYQPANHLAFRLADKVMVPDGFSTAMLRRQGATPASGDGDRVVVFPGLKEHVSMLDFSPDPDFPACLRALGVDTDGVVATVRPPATSSLYHRFANDWFYGLLDHIARQPGVSVVALPRYPAQEARIHALGHANVTVPTQVLDGRDLVYRSDLVVSAGGSMNREAVVLGTPAYTAFAGRMAGVDRNLIRQGALVQLRSQDDVHLLRVEKNARPGLPGVDGSVADRIVDEVLATVTAGGRRRRALGRRAGSG